MRSLNYVARPQTMKIYWLLVLLALLCGCKKQNGDYVVVTYHRRPTVVFKTYSNADTDTYLIRHGNVLIEAECGREYQPSWDKSVPIMFHCLLPVGKPLLFEPVPGFVGRKGLRYSANGKSIDLVVISEEIK